MNFFGTWTRPNERAVQRQEHRFALSILFAGLAISLLSIAFGHQIPAFWEKSRMTSLMSPISQGRLKVIEHHAATGDWLTLDETKPDEEYPTTFISTQIGHIRQGAVHIEVRNRKSSLSSSEWWPTQYRRLQQGNFDTVDHNRNNLPTPPEWWSIRPAIMGNDAPTIFWICGSRSPPKGFHALGEDLTTIPPRENFWLCR
jgi:hypothetical protein